MRKTEMPTRKTYFSMVDCGQISSVLPFIASSRSAVFPTWLGPAYVQAKPRRDDAPGRIVMRTASRRDARQLPLHKRSTTYVCICTTRGSPVAQSGKRASSAGLVLRRTGTAHYVVQRRASLATVSVPPSRGEPIT